MSSRLLRAIAALVTHSQAGTLPASAHWLTESRLVYLRKPDSDTPRPIRVGEFWRRLVAKRLVCEHKAALQELLLRARQCGVAVAGGCDVLVHLRRCLEHVLAASDEAFVILDLDLRNAFPSLEWSAIRAAVSEHAPDLLPWTSWCHQSASRVLLPNGTWFECNRGAEQGDPLGPVYCALTLLGVASAARDAVVARGGWSWDAWFMDDSQVCLPPSYVDDFLSAFDAKLSDVGGTRVTSGTFKSTARLCGTATARDAAPANWDNLAKSSCKIIGAPPEKVLGVGIVGDSIAAQFKAASRAASAASDALAQLKDPAAELALLRMSTSACRVVHLLRAVGPELPLADVLAFDENLEGSLGVILGGAVGGLALDRAVTGARDGGLGLRRVRETQLPAFIASRTEARALAVDVSGGLPTVVSDALFSRWDAQVANALASWKKELPLGVSAVADQLVVAAAEQSRQRAWELRGDLPQVGQAPPERSRERTTAALLTLLGLEDPEFPHRESEGLQTRLCGLASASRASSLSDQYAAAGDFSSVQMLEDLCNEETDRSWLWLAGTVDGPPTKSHEFCTAVRLRIGADLASDDQECACCGGKLDRKGLHSLCCAPGESTRGHGAVASVVHSLARLSDASASTEPRGLVPSYPALRPADVLTSVAFGRQAALDICVASPDGAGAGSDACAAAARRKSENYAGVIEELSEEGCDYRPLVWSCWGRPGGPASSALRCLAAAAARRRGIASGEELERRARALIGAHIWVRAARMALACLRGPRKEEAAELLPAVVEDSDGEEAE